MSKISRLWGILGSAALVMLIGLFQSSAHATPGGALGILPPTPMVAPASMNSIPASVPTNRLQQGAVSQQTPLSSGIAFFSNPENVLRTVELAAQFIFGVYGVSLVRTGIGYGKTATKSAKNGFWGVLIVGIAFTAPQLLSWVVANTQAEAPISPMFSRGGCG
jgi:hypothetical protein